MRPGCPMAAPHLPLAVSVCGPWQSPHRKSIKERLRECRANFLDCWVRGKNQGDSLVFTVVMGLSCGFPLHPSQIAVENHERQNKLILNLKEKHTEKPWNDMEWTGLSRAQMANATSRHLPNWQQKITGCLVRSKTQHRQTGQTSLRIAPDLPSRAEKKDGLICFSRWKL